MSQLAPASISGAEKPADVLALISSTHLLLGKVHGLIQVVLCMIVSKTCRSAPCTGRVTSTRTLTVRLALLPPASRIVDGVHEASSSSSLLLLALGVRAVASGEVLEHVHL